MAPVNDAFADALVLTGAGGDGVTELTAATREVDEPASPLGHDTTETVWLTHTPAAPGSLSIAVSSPDVEPLNVDVWEGDVLAEVENVASAVTDAVVAAARTNLVPNPSFEVNTTGWTGSNGTLARSTAQAHTGTASLLYTVTTPTPISNIAFTALTAAVVGTAYTGQFRVRMATATPRTLRARIQWVNGSGLEVASTYGPDTLVDDAGWVLLSATGTAPATTATMRIIVANNGAPVASDAWHVDAVLLEAAGALGPYFDGESVHAAWTGTAHQSTSTRPELAAAVLTDVPLAQGVQYSIRLNPLTSGATSSADYTWTYTERVPELLLTVREDDLDRTPSTLRASITNAAPEAVIEFTVDSADVTGGTVVPDPILTEVLDATGVLADIAVPIPALNAGDSTVAGHAYRLIATESLAGVATGRYGAVEFTVAADPDAAPTDLPGDAPPVLVPQTSEHRWAIQDPAPGGTHYVFPINPSQMTSPHAPRPITVETTVAADGQPVTYEGSRKPHGWEFSGRLPDHIAHHDALAAYVASNRRYHLIDHRKRAWVVSFEDFESTPLIKPGHPDAHDYRMRCLIYSGPEQL